MKRAAEKPVLLKTHLQSRIWSKTPLFLSPTPLNQRSTFARQVTSLETGPPAPFQAVVFDLEVHQTLNKTAAPLLRDVFQCVGCAEMHALNGYLMGYFILHSAFWQTWNGADTSRPTPTRDGPDAAAGCNHTTTGRLTGDAAADLRFVWHGVAGQPFSDGKSFCTIPRTKAARSRK